MTRLLLPALLTAALLLAACTPAEDDAADDAVTDDTVTEDVVDEVNQEVAANRMAVANIEPLEGSDVTGQVTFEDRGDHVYVSGTVEGLEEGKHGFHIHEGTSCAEPGGHYNPEGSPHGSPNEPARHLGDLGNLVAEGGAAEVEHIDRLVTLSGPNSVEGHAIIVHQGEDQFIPQPSGSSGTPIGCGIIQLQGE